MLIALSAWVQGATAREDAASPAAAEIAWEWPAADSGDSNQLQWLQPEADELDLRAPTIAHGDVDGDGRLDSLLGTAPPTIWMNRGGPRVE